MTAERYTAVFTGFLSVRKPGEYFYLAMIEDPVDPGGRRLRRGLPPYELIGREIPFGDLPEGCRYLVLDVYRKLWDL